MAHGRTIVGAFVHPREEMGQKCVKLCGASIVHVNELFKEHGWYFHIIAITKHEKDNKCPTRGPCDEAFMGHACPFFIISFNFPLFYSFLSFHSFETICQGVSASRFLKFCGKVSNL